MPPPAPVSSFAAIVETDKVIGAVSAAVAAAFLMFKGMKKLTLSPPPATLSPLRQAEEKARTLACERVACPGRPVVLNPMRQRVV